MTELTLLTLHFSVFGPPTISICPLFAVSFFTSWLPSTLPFFPFLISVLLYHSFASNLHPTIYFFTLPFHSPLLRTFSHFLSLLPFFSLPYSALCIHTFAFRRYQGSDLPSSSFFVLPSHFTLPCYVSSPTPSHFFLSLLSPYSPLCTHTSVFRRYQGSDLPSSS